MLVFSEIVNTNQTMKGIFSGSYKAKQFVPDERGPEAMVGKLYCKIEISLGKVRKCHSHSLTVFVFMFVCFLPFCFLFNIVFIPMGGIYRRAEVALRGWGGRQGTIHLPGYTTPMIL